MEAPLPATALGVANRVRFGPFVLLETAIGGARATLSWFWVRVG